MRLFSGRQHRHGVDLLQGGHAGTGDRVDGNIHRRSGADTDCFTDVEHFQRNEHNLNRGVICGVFIDAAKPAVAGQNRRGRIQWLITFHDFSFPDSQEKYYCQFTALCRSSRGFRLGLMGLLLLILFFPGTCAYHCFRLAFVAMIFNTGEFLFDNHLLRTASRSLQSRPPDPPR
ncbi:MAG: hypothetical protein GPOALKHO_001047 [Sodalis sp.]|nr:MAG: hypothetical protein GPOALKHO_001047 [Sodalis sp.]